MGMNRLKGSWLEQLTARAAKPSRLVAGVLSGTSMDSVDVALCGISETHTVKLIGFHQEPYAPALRNRLRSLETLTVRDISELHTLLGESFAAACLHAFQTFNVRAEDVDLIGSHGQTVYHHSAVPGAMRSTLQLGDADVIAARTGIAVIADFRARDIACGGEGAPLTPYADRIFYQLDDSAHRAILNLGGIANLTFIERGPGGAIVGFDTGPANAPLDRLARILSQGRLACDLDGAFARAGQVNIEALQWLLRDDYLLAPPPKSTGFERYGDAFLEELLARYGPVSTDLIATLTEFVARSVSDAMRDFVWPRADVTEIVLAGGGGRNPELRRRLADAVAPAVLVDSEAIGVLGQAREAMAFALLAHDALLGLATSLPSVTGASQPAVLGKLSFPA
jgi:anhydro-N-acetylmuramic acid kinase